MAAEYVRTHGRKVDEIMSRDLVWATADTRLDSQGDKLMQRLVYRNFRDHQAILAAHSINSSPGKEGGVRCGLKVYEGLNHGFIRYGRLVAAARGAVADCAAALSKALGA